MVVLTATSGERVRAEPFDANTYSAERQNGAWVVVGDVMDWES
jgi:hypothetical protein